MNTIRPSAMILGMVWATVSMAGECLLDQRDMQLACTKLIRQEAIAKFCPDMTLPDPLAIGEECATRVRKAGGRTGCRPDDVTRLIPTVVGETCRKGDTVVLKDPSQPRWPGRSSISWAGSEYDQRLLTVFCDRASIKKLDIGDYTCVIDRGL